MPNMALHPGKYQIEVSKEGYASISRDVALNADITLQVELNRTWQDPATGMQFMWVPGGCYQMGCRSWTDSCDENEKPVHEVCLDGFWLGKYEVTQGQWESDHGGKSITL